MKSICDLVVIMLNCFHFILMKLIGVFTGFDFLDDEIDEHDDDISGFGWDLQCADYKTPEPGESRQRHSPLYGSESDDDEVYVVAFYCYIIAVLLADYHYYV